MDNILLKQNIIEYIEKLKWEKLACTNNDIISVRIDNNSFFTTPSGKSLTEITIDDIVKINLNDKNSGEYQRHSIIYSSREDINAIIHVYPKNCCAMANSGLSVPAVLDDMAQIVGPSAKCTISQDNATIIKTLKGRNCCFIKNDGVITTGRTLDEAYVGCLVLEKAAQVYIEGSVLGGTKIINIFEAKLMRFIYKKKYSKIDQDQKMAETKQK